MSFHFTRPFCAVAVSALSSAFLVWSSPAAHAQGLFESLFGSSGRSSERPYPRVHRDDRFPGVPDFSAERPMAYGPADDADIPRRRPPRGLRAAETGGTLCVRMCDGRHFPLPRAANGVALDPVKVCGTLCPQAKTQVFRGSSPETAVAKDGTRYADLDTAFAYRERLVPDCSCTGRGPGGLAQINIESDPTLRAGDIVADAKGLIVFKGSRGLPHKAADFTPIGDYAGLNADLRRKLAAIKVAPSSASATAAPFFAPAGQDAGASERRSRTQRQARGND